MVNAFSIDHCTDRVPAKTFAVLSPCFLLGFQMEVQKTASAGDFVTSCKSTCAMEDCL